MKASIWLREMFVSNQVPGTTGHSLYKAALAVPLCNVPFSLRSCALKVDARRASHLGLSGLAARSLRVVAGPLSVGPSELFELPLGR